MKVLLSATATLSEVTAVSMRAALVLLIGITAPVSSQSVRVEVQQPEIVVPATTDAGDVRFSSVAWATRLTSAEIAVADMIDASVRIIGPDGSLRRTLGRRGGGPGEYRLPVWVGRCAGDSLYVWDASARLTSYSAAAASGETPATRTITEGASSLSAACAPDGSIALLQMMQPRRDIPPVRSGESPNGGQYSVVEMVATLAVADAQGAVRSAKEQFSQGQWVMGQLTPQGGMGGVPRPLAPKSSFAFSGGTLVVAEAATGAVTGIASDGRVEFSFKVESPSRRTTDNDYRRAVQPAITPVPPPMQEAAANFLRAIPKPDTIPTFWRVLTDPDGLIWLVVSAEGASETQFSVYTSTGDLVGEPRIPGTFVPFEVGRTHLLGRRESPDGEEEIVVLRVMRAGQR